jgi:hypothetical protein
VTFESNESADENVILGVVVVDMSERSVEVADDDVRGALKMSNSGRTLFPH